MGFNVEIEMKIPTLSSQTNGNVILLEYIYRIRPVYFVLIDQEVLFVSIYFTENIFIKLGHNRVLRNSSI